MYTAKMKPSVMYAALWLSPPRNVTSQCHGTFDFQIWTCDLDVISYTTGMLLLKTHVYQCTDCQIKKKSFTRKRPDYFCCYVWVRFWVSTLQTRGETQKQRLSSYIHTLPCQWGSDRGWWLPAGPFTAGVSNISPVGVRLGPPDDLASV